MNQVRFGVVGLGNIGSLHVRSLSVGGEAVLGAVCDTDRSKREKIAREVPGVPVFEDYQEMLRSGLIDAALIAVPHYQHVPMALQAFEHNLHVLSEKPISVTVGEARRLNAAHKHFPHLKFGIMFQMRTSPLLSRVREIICSGELGEISRVTWIVTDWFRTHTYYASGGWRATWAGEGGGVLINQCPHNLDQIGWITGLIPQRVTAVAAIGKRHPIEVEDEVSAIIEFDNGAIGHFMTSTGEAPGTNRLEIAGDRGKIIAEAGKISFRRTRQSVDEINRTSPKSFINVETDDVEVPVSGKGGPEGHQIIVENFVGAVLRGDELLAPGIDGVKALELGNAMLMAGITRQPVELPLDAEKYQSFIEEMGRQYGGRKQIAVRNGNVADEMGTSFGDKATK